MILITCKFLNRVVLNEQPNTKAFTQSATSRIHNSASLKMKVDLICQGLENLIWTAPSRPRLPRSVDGKMTFAITLAFGEYFTWIAGLERVLAWLPPPPAQALPRRSFGVLSLVVAIAAFGLRSRPKDRAV